ncbi:MAG: hypothetical protein WBL65_27120 [Bryobacteraceae bacterium]
MESATCRTVTALGFQPNTELVVLDKPPISEDGEYQKFLNELQSYGCGYWKWLRKRRIREVFVVGSVRNPEAGKIDKIRIKRKTADSIELADCRFDIKTGRSLYGEPKYIFPVENRLVWDAWEPQSLRQRVERGLPALPFKAVRAYADLLHPNWHLGLFNFSFTGAADSLSERAAASMASCREFAKKAILCHLPRAIQEFRALVEMMERDAK